MKKSGATPNKKDTTQGDSVLSYMAWLAISAGAGFLLWHVAGLQGAFN